MALPCIMSTLHGVVEQKPPKKVFTAQYAETRTGRFEKENCPVGTRPERVIEYTRGYTGIATSNISQEDALAKAKEQAKLLADTNFDRDGQEYANQNISCVAIPTYSFTFESNKREYFTRNNCPTRHTTQPVEFSKTYRATETSTVSQADAETKARNKVTQLIAQDVATFNAEGQAFANQNGICIAIPEPTVFTGTYNGVLTGTFTRNNCPAQHTTTPVTFTKQITGTATSTVSQADANNRARTEAERIGNLTFQQEGQAYANANGVCTPPPIPVINRIRVTQSPQTAPNTGGPIGQLQGTTVTVDGSTGSNNIAERSYNNLSSTTAIVNMSMGYGTFAVEVWGRELQHKYWGYVTENQAGGNFEIEVSAGDGVTHDFNIRMFRINNRGRQEVALHEREN